MRQQMPYTPGYCDVENGIKNRSAVNLTEKTTRFTRGQ